MEDQSTAIYTIVINGKPQGPYALEYLKDIAVLPGTFIRKPGMDDYQEAHEFPELCALFGFSYEQVTPQYFASFDQRLLASVIDYFILTLFYIFLILLSFIVITEKDQRIMIGLLFLPAIPVFKFIYGSFADASARQGTVGKQLLNIKVTDMGGQRINFSTAVIRNGAKILSVLSLFFGYLYCFLNKRGQTWHDIAANTLVIKDRLI